MKMKNPESTSSLIRGIHSLWVWLMVLGLEKPQIPQILSQGGVCCTEWVFLCRIIKRGWLSLRVTSCRKFRACAHLPIREFLGIICHIIRIILYVMYYIIYIIY